MNTNPMNAPEPDDPAQPAFESLRLDLPEGDELSPRYDWRARYAEEHTPWDLGGTHPGLAAWWQAQGAQLGLKSAVVPGCGKGHDVLFLARQGLRVSGVDVVDLCADNFATELVELGGAFHLANFLAAGRPEGPTPAQLGGPFDLLYEHTIFCAIEPDQRAAFGRAAAACVKPGGYLLSFLFPGDKPLEAGGPPHRAEPAHLSAALGDAFELLSCEPSHAHPPGQRQWSEARLLFRRV